MGSKIRIGTWELILMLVGIIVIQTILNFPRAIARQAGTAGWIQVIFLTAITLLVFAVQMWLYKGFDGKDILDIAQMGLGTPLRIFTGISIIMYLGYGVAIVLRELAEDMKTVALPVSPLSMVTGMFVIGMIAACYLGLEAIARVSIIVVPITILGFAFIVISASTYYRIDNILPILGNGPKAIFVGGLPTISIYSAMALLFLFPSFMAKHENTKRIGITTICISAAIFLISTLSYSLLLPYPMTLQSFLPLHQMARLIEYGRFFQRIESLFFFIWGSSALLYLSTVMFFILFVIKKTFRLKYYRPLIFPVAILLFTMSFFPPNLMTALIAELTIIRRYSWIVTFGIITIVLTIAKMRKKRSERNDSCAR